MIVKQWSNEYTDANHASKNTEPLLNHLKTLCKPSSNPEDGLEEVGFMVDSDEDDDIVVIEDTWLKKSEYDIVEHSVIALDDDNPDYTSNMETVTKLVINYVDGQTEVSPSSSIDSYRATYTFVRPKTTENEPK